MLRRPDLPKRHPGFTLVELLIGLTVGLFVLAGASVLMISQLRDHKALTLETRAEQDVRAVGELMMRELREAGSWQRPGLATWSPGNPAPIANPYATVTVGAGGQSVEFSITSATNPEVENNVLDSHERRGFKVESGVLKSLNGAAGWQPLTDPQSLRINSLRFTVDNVRQNVEGACSRDCAGAANCPPWVEARTLRVEMDAEAASDKLVQRRLDFRVRLQTDLSGGTCPS